MKRFILILSLLLAGSLEAALPAGGVINIQSTATAGNLNGGGFNAARGGVDYSTQNAAQLTATDGTAAGGTTFTSATGGFTTAMEGNYIHLTASTGLTLGWYEIVTRTDTNNVVLDRTPGTGTATTYYVGGAMSLASTLDDDLFEIGVPGNIFYVKGAVTYTLGEAVSITAAGGASQPIFIKGYTTTQGDECTGSNRPVLASGANSFTYGANWNGSNLSHTTTQTTNGIVVGTNGIFTNIKIVNSSTTAGANGCTIAANNLFLNCEFVSYRGDAVAASNFGNLRIIGCWLHDSNVGFTSSQTSGGSVLSKNIISSNVTAAVQYTAAMVAGTQLDGNTLFGSTNTTGIGISIATGTTNLAVTNNIISGFVTGVVHADTQTIGFDNYNDYYNNDADVSAAGQWQKGPNDTAVNPSFTSVGQVTGATATTTSGNHLVQSGATFITSGVTAGRDYVYVVSGTGVTAGIYGIASVDSETQITTDITLTANATADKVFQITTGQNFAVGTAMKALGFPGAFPGGYSAGYLDQGAAQRQESGGQRSYSQ